MMPSHNSELIAGWKTAAQWLQCRATLQAGADAATWIKAFNDFFVTRLDSRYRYPIKVLQDNGTFQGEGFSILTIQCSLIEYFESSIQGKNYRFARRGQQLGQWEYSKSQEIYVSFLCTRPPFDSHFDKALAEDFYQNVRCGLLHEACTKGSWLVRARDLSDAEAIVDRKQKIVFRDGFQIALDKFVDWYRKELAIDAEMQHAFIRKFDDLCV